VIDRERNAGGPGTEIPQEKRCSLLASRSSIDGARVIAMFPGAAKEFREQIKQGLAEDVGASLTAKVVLRQFFDGQIRMLPGEDGGLYAEYLQQRSALLQGVGTDGGPCSHRIYGVTI
jgi:hypothetical protein